MRTTCYNTEYICILPAWYIYAFVTILRLNTDYFPQSHLVVNLYNAEGLCSLRGTK